MNVKELKEIIALMQEHGLSELEIEKNGSKIRLKKSSGGIEIRQNERLEPVRIVSATEMLQDQQVVKDPENVYVVRSPMVGTFYASPAPDKEPYVAKGKAVKEGDVLCIIEAMKLMNEIKTDVGGRVIDVLVNNGQPIEFDQPLFKIQKL